jgi:hypothetical protein
VTIEIPALSTDPHVPPRVPRGLGKAGRALWVGVASRYSLRYGDELPLLEQAARVADLIEVLRTEQADSSLTTRGSMGQLVAAPLLGELRQARAQLQSLLKTLGLPDEAVQVGGGQKSPRHQRAVQTRWANHRAAVEDAGALAERRAA